MSANVFVGDRILADAGFAAARRQLGRLAGDGVLLGAAEYAYGAGITGLAEAAGVTGEPPRLAGVRPGELTETAGCARLALRWEAVGANGALFPALDADLTLTPAGEATTLLALAGIYRLPEQMGAELNPAIVRCFAAVTIRGFVARLACAVMHPAGAGLLAELAAQDSPPRPPAWQATWGQ
jgi:hypothetical protein